MQQLETADGPAHYAAMHNEHSTAGQAQHPASDSRLKVMEAIARRKAVEAQYNGKRIKLAPHMLFERRGDLFVSALNMSKSWRSEEERRLGQFKLSGLGEPDLLDEGLGVE